MLRPVRIGTVTIENPIGLAPMAGVTDMTFRCLCREQGAGLLCTEMVSAKALIYHNPNTKALLESEKGEHPLAVQLFGSDPEAVARGAQLIEDYPFDLIDFNMGCPVPKVVKNGEGSALMKDPVQAGKVLSALVKAVKKPVTVKIRSGFDADHLNAPEIAKIAEEAGVAAVAVHARTREQFYSGKADWGIIAEVKQTVSVPVFGNGDITDGPSAKAMIEQTGCDGILIGRAAKGNPWIFSEIRSYLGEWKESGENQSPCESPGFREDQIYCGLTDSAGSEEKSAIKKEHPSEAEVIAMILRHAEELVKAKGEFTAIRQMRSHAAWYTAGMRNASALRRELNHVETLEQLRGLFERTDP